MGSRGSIQTPKKGIRAQPFASAMSLHAFHGCIGFKPPMHAQTVRCTPSEQIADGGNASMKCDSTTKALARHALKYLRFSSCLCMQLSILRIFHQMLGDGAFRRQPSSGPLLHFSTGIVRALFKRLVPTPEAPLEPVPPQHEQPQGATQDHAVLPKNSDVDHPPKKVSRFSSLVQGSS